MYLCLNDVSKHRVTVISTRAWQNLVVWFPTIPPAVVTGLFGDAVRHDSGVFIFTYIFFFPLHDYRCNSR